MPAQKIAISLVVVAAMAAVLFAKVRQEVNSGSGMVKAATGFLETLTPAQRSKADFAYDDAERLNWHFIPRERKGLPLKELEGDALKSAHRLIASGLSNAGYDQAINVMSLEVDDFEDIIVIHRADALVGQAGVSADALAGRAVANHTIFGVDNLPLVDRFGQ